MKKPSPWGLRPQARVGAQPPKAALGAETEGGRRPDEGRACRYNPFMGNNGKPAPHQSASQTASPVGEAFYLQFQIPILDPAFFAQELTEKDAQDGGQDKADERQPGPVKGRDDPAALDSAGIDADLADQTAGAHAA